MELLGRDDELGLVDEVIASARAGRGRAVFVTGDAGLGKTTVLDAARARASAANVTVLAGAAWEAGGAPSYWPWLQILRDAAGAFGAEVRALPGAARIATLVPEWGEGRVTVTPDPGADRFALLDAVARGLVALSARAPLAVLLDDLHAADLPSLELLGLFVRELPRAAIAVIGAWREGELAARPEVAQRLARAARHAEVRPLRRLTADEVTTWATGRGGDGAALFAFSEGNPLFVEEALRARHAGVPRSVDAVLRDHLALVSPATRDVLGAAAVLGRHAGRATLRAIVLRTADAVLRAPAEPGLAIVLRTADAVLRAPAEPGLAIVLRTADAVLRAPAEPGLAIVLRTADAVLRAPAEPGLAIAGEVDAAMAEAAAAGIVEPRDDGWAFTHVLLRDHLYAALAPERRAALHRAAGALVDPEDPTGGRAAHHRLRGAIDDPAPAIDAARAAAVIASRLFAFEDAAALLEAAAAIARDERETGWLRLDAAIARRNAGDVVGARAAATAAIAIARALGDADLLARAAMEHAAELASGRRDPAMVALLQEAVASLPTGDSSIRARTLARLGTAVSPPTDRHDRTPMNLSDEATAMARRLGDDEAMLYALRHRGHTYGYLEPYSENAAVCIESVTIAERLGRPLEALEQSTWLIGLAWCAGDLAESDRARDRVLALLAPLHQPQFKWRTSALFATRAILRGELDEAARHLAVVRSLAQDHRVERARGTALFLGLSLLQTDAEACDAREVLAEAGEILRLGGPPLLGPAAFLHAMAGDEAEARRTLAAAFPAPALIVSQLGGEAALRLRDHEQAARFLPALQVSALHYPMVVGPAGGANFCPAEIVIGELLLMVGQRDEGVAAIGRGLALARALQAPRYIARGEAALARAGTVEARPTDDVPEIHDDGRVRWRGRAHALAPSKGLAYLARLVEAVGRELHVSELVGDDDQGDAGEVIDTAARDAYRRRALDLRAQLDDAEDRHDVGRAERARAELDALTEQLSAAVGLGGRARKAASHVERARINVQRRLKDAIKRIAELDAPLGRYLEAAVRTGTFCSFQPLP